MLKKLFSKKQSPYEQFELELLKKDPNTQILDKIISSGDININHKNNDSQSFLHITLKAKKLKSAQWLISKKIKADTEDNNSKRPIEIAIDNQNYKIIQSMLQNCNININKKDQFERTLLQNSVILGDLKTIKILLEYKADINSTDRKKRNVMYDALSYGNKEVINYLLTFKELELNHLDTDNNSIFQHKYIKMNNEIGMMLIENGANPTIINNNGSSFLYDCAIKGMENYNILICAIEQGFDINAKIANKNSITIGIVNELIKAKEELNRDRRHDLLPMLRKLSEKGLDISAFDENNETALFKAVRFKDMELIELLLELRINTNIQNKKKQTALAIAVYDGIENFNIIVNLLKYKADPTILNEQNKTLYEEINDIVLQASEENITKEDNKKLHLDQKNNHFNRILKELLRYNKKDLNFLDSTGNPLFYKPLMYNNIMLFKTYSSAGLDIYKLNKIGHNIFFEYVLKVFKDNNEKIDFKSVLIMLVSAKVNHNIQDNTGWTVICKLLFETPCNINLFKTLVQVVKFDYTIADQLGRTAIHTAVWKGNTNIIRIINHIDIRIKNIPDNYGILPIVYAALLGNQELVLMFIDIKAKPTLDKWIAKSAIEKFKPMLANLDKLTHGLKDTGSLIQINNVVNQIRKDFEDRNDLD